MLARNFCFFILSSAACLLVAKLVVGLTLLPLDQQRPSVAKLDVISKTTTVRYCDSKTVTQAQFKIKNRGDKRLVVNTKEFDCDCYVAKQHGSLTILPGQEKLLSIPISMHAIEYRSEIKFLLITNDPTQPSVTLRIEVLDRPPLVPAGAVSVLQD